MLLCCHKSSRHDDGRGAFLKNRDRVKLEDFCKQHCIDYWIDNGQLNVLEAPEPYDCEEHNDITVYLRSPAGRGLGMHDKIESIELSAETYIEHGMPCVLAYDPENGFSTDPTSCAFYGCFAI